jgi:hypothetical protein
MRKLIQSLVVLIIINVLCHNNAVAAVGNDFGGTDIPNVAGEQVTVLPLIINDAITESWKTSGNVNLKKSDTLWNGKDVLELNYRILKADDVVCADYALAQNHPIAERLRFWIKSDGSCSDLNILCYHFPSKSWVSLATVELKSYQWLHLEIPAGNPFYLYYSSITAFRFAISNKNDIRDFGEKQALLSGLELVSPVVITKPLQNRPVAAPVFDTWGGPSQQQFIDSRPVGTTVHLAPIGFFGDTPVPQRVDYVLKAIKWASGVGIAPGIQFYGHPGKWIESHPEMFAKNQDGQIQRDGGSI